LHFKAVVSFESMNSKSLTPHRPINFSVNEKTETAVESFQKKHAKMHETILRLDAALKNKNPRDLK
jgi:hypothetical protein